MSREGMKREAYHSMLCNGESLADGYALIGEGWVSANG